MEALEAGGATSSPPFPGIVLKPAIPLRESLWAQLLRHMPASHSVIGGMVTCGATFVIAEVIRQARSSRAGRGLVAASI